jgi:hypothetical protein
MLNHTVTPKKLISISLLCVTILCVGSLSLKSTGFQRIYKGNKLIIAMTPVYSDGDPAPQAPQKILAQNAIHNNDNNIADKQKALQPSHTIIQQTQQTQQKIATMQPILIIPHYTPEKKLFIKKQTVAVNSYLEKRVTPQTRGAVVFEGKIPTSGSKYLRPSMASHNNNDKKDLPQVYKQYVSIEQ